jgi:molybdopterin-binding protein
MNQVSGEIVSIETHGHLSLVQVRSGQDRFSALVVDYADPVPYLKAGEPVNLLFKENELFLAKGFSGELSIQNRFPGTIRGITRGKLLSRVVLDYGSRQITSVITTRAVDQMSLEPGDEVIGMVKTNEMLLSPHD